MTAIQESSQCTPAALLFRRVIQTTVDLVFVPPSPELEIAVGWSMTTLTMCKLTQVCGKRGPVTVNAGDAWASLVIRCGSTTVLSERKVSFPSFAATGGDRLKLWHFCPRGCTSDRRMPEKGRLVVLHQDRLTLYHPCAPVATGKGRD